ncbi:MAG: endonuclease [Hyphomicrobiales bacterium]
MAKSARREDDNHYLALIEKIFFDRYKPGIETFEFERTELEKAAKTLKIALPKNLGDVIYSIRYRVELPKKIRATQPSGLEWIVEGSGRSMYAFRLARVARLAPNPNLAAIKIPDATPEIIGAYALSDEQSLLAKLRYNRLIDIFLGIAAYSLQNHLRTTAKQIGQVEIDEVYVGIDKAGRQFIVPVQAKGGSDKLSSVQTNQDIAVCKEKFADLICRPVSAQFMADNLIALFELRIVDGDVRIAEEKHYELVAAKEIGVSDLAAYRISK